MRRVSLASLFTRRCETLTSSRGRGLVTLAAAETTRRVVLQVQYDGGGYNGWEKKPGTDTRTVQGLLEHAAHSAFGRGAADFTFPVQGSSRTDAGVHAAANVAHLDLPGCIRLDGPRVARALQRHLPPGIVVRRSAAAPSPGWDARSNARGRRYRYAIYNGQTPDAFLAAVSWHFQGGTLDAAAMHDALQTLRSDHPRDLSALARVERHRHLRELRASEKTAREMNPSSSHAESAQPVKLQQIQDVRAWREEQMVYVEIQADRFLYGQCRILVGTLAMVGSGRISVQEFERLCAPGAPVSGRQAAPAQGLCLMQVHHEPCPFAANDARATQQAAHHPFALL